MRIAEAFSKQRSDTLSRFSNAFKSVRKAVPIDDLVDIEVWQGYMIEASTDVIGATVVEAGTNALAELGRQAAFDLAAPPVVSFVDKSTAKFARETNKTTVKALRSSLQQGITAGESIPDLRKRVEGVFDIAESSRATMIARSETVRASNFGAIEGFEQSGVVEGKEWLTAFDERTCPWCEAMDGKILDLNGSFLGVGESFTAGGRTLNNNYADVQFPPLHPNCRCTLIPVIVDGVDVSEPELPPLEIEIQESSTIQ